MKLLKPKFILDWGKIRKDGGFLKLLIWKTGFIEYFVIFHSSNSTQSPFSFIKSIRASTAFSEGIFLFITSYPL